MPISQPFLAPTLANLRLASFGNLLSQLPSLENSLSATGMNPTRVANVVKGMKSRLLNVLTLQIKLAADEATALALSSATEGDSKCAGLTPIIAGTPVDAAAVTNAAELIATIAQGASADQTLSQLRENANELLT